MRIIFLLTQDLDSPSGLGRYRPMALELAKRNHEVQVFALHSDFQSLPSDKRNTKIDGVNVHYVAQMHVRKVGNLKHYFNPLILIWIALRATIALTQSALRTPCDWVIIGKPHPMNGIAGGIKKFASGCKLIVDCDDNETESNRYSRGWQKKIINSFEKRIPHLADYVTANSTSSIQNLIESGIQKERIIYLPNGAARERFNLQDLLIRRDQIRNELHWENNKIITYTGSLSLSTHPINLLISAFPLIHQQIPEARLLIVGGGEDHDKIFGLVQENKISEYVHFAGRIQQDYLPTYLSAADISVDPVYDNDTAKGRNPLKMYESWACGVPFITGAVGDRSILLKETGAGFLVHPGDPISLAEGIIQILNNKQLQMDLINNGLIAIQRFYWDSLIVNIDQIFLNA